MFAKRRTTAALLIVGFLVASLGMFAPSTEGACEDSRILCCDLIRMARQVCGMFPHSQWCADFTDWANEACTIAASECGTFSCS